MKTPDCTILICLVQNINVFVNFIGFTKIVLGTDQTDFMTQCLIRDVGNQCDKEQAHFTGVCLCARQ